MKLPELEGRQGILFSRRSLTPFERKIRAIGTLGFTEEIKLTEFDSRMSQNVVSRRDMEIDIWQYERDEIRQSLKVNGMFPHR